MCNLIIRKVDTILLYDLDEYIRQEYSVLDAFGVICNQLELSNDSYFSISEEWLVNMIRYLKNLAEDERDESEEEALKVYTVLNQMMENNEIPKDFLLLICW